MKTLLFSMAAFFVVVTAKAQYTQNFEGNENSLTGNCWLLAGLHITNVPADVITGTGSLYSDPITNNAIPADLTSPALNIISTNFTVGFSYRLSTPLNGSAQRTIEIGLLDPAGAFTSLQVIILDNNTPATVQNFSQAYTLASTGARRLVFRLSGSNGNGNVRLIMDNIATNASALYGSGTCNSAPVAVDDVFFGPIGSTIIGNVMTNDTEPDGETMQAILVANSPHGTLTLNANGSFSFIMDPNYNGTTATFTYRLTDNGFNPATSNIATVTINFILAGSLPVKLVSFNAMLNNNNTVNLTWITATEISVSHFVIERSTDGRNFNEAGIVFANGNTSTNSNYSLTDNISNTAAAVIYYRLRSVDIDGKSQVSETRIIRLEKQTDNKISILTYPNPVSNELRITIPNNWQNKKATYEVVNVNGQVSAKVETSNSSQTETINVSKMAPGFYIVRVTCDGQTAQQKIVKQ